MKVLLFPFGLSTHSSRNFATTASYDEMVRGQVIDALMTNQGERVYRADYGCDIQSALFDPSDELVRADAANFISQKLQALVPRAVIVSVEVTSPDTEPGVVYVTVTYRPSVFTDTQTLRVPISSEFLRRATTGDDA
jgi:hypothetical protein